MQSPSFVQALQGYGKQFETATTLDEVLCLTVLVASKLLPSDATVTDATREWVKTYEGYCPNCPAHDYCIACVINE